MYTKDLGHRMTLRLTEEQRDFLHEMSDMTGMKPSDYLRMMINSTMYAYRKAQASQATSIEEITKEISQTLKGEVGTSNENVKTDKHDIVQQ